MTELESTDAEMIRTGEEVAEAQSPGRRRVVARGTIINSVFLVGLGVLNLLKAFIVAAFLTAAEFGVWSVIFLAVAFVGAIKAAAVSDKYVQQEEPDQELAFQKAFTLELISGAVMTVAMLAIAPLLTALYGDDELLGPALAFALLLIPLSIQAGSISVYYRRMEFLRQRLLLAIDPVVSFVVTIALAAGGAGYWSLVIGSLAGTFVGAVVALVACPYPVRFRFDRATLREYVSFSWPLVLAVGVGLMIAQLSVYFGDVALGLAGAGAIGLAATYQSYTDRVDAVVTAALYPAICRVADRSELMLEAFVKSNRLALMWGFPFGVGLSLFAADLINFGIGEQWKGAIFLFQVFGALAAVNHIGFNWTAFFRATGDTRPIAIVTIIAFVAFCTTAVPLLLWKGLNGFAVGMAAVAVASLAARFFYLNRIFPSLRIALYALRALAPTVPAVLAVVAMRAAIGGDRTPELALAELALYIAVTAVATLVFERRLLSEALGYLRSGPDRRLRPA